METIALLPIFLALGWMLSKNISNSEHKSDYIKIDDKNWIVKGEFVSFEEDTPALQFQQEMEDNEQYRKFENNKLKRDRDRIFEDYMKTTKAIQEHEFLQELITDENLSKHWIEYEQYLLMCDKLGEGLNLEYDEYVIMKEAPVWCGTIHIMNPLSTASIYNIYNAKTARYYNGNTTELMEAEFKQKWY